MTDDELEELSYSALEELLGCGVERRTLLRYFKTIRNRATPAPAQPDPLHVANERGEGEDAKDAARYRWLRDRLPWALMSAHGYTRMAARLPVSIKADMDEAHEMDAALDAAMASGLSAIAQALAAAPKEKP